MDKFNENGFSMDPNADTFQEGFDAADSSFTDFMGGKFDYPKDQSSNHSQLKNNQMPDMDEAGANPIGYINKAPGFEPNPGKFFEPFDK
jgi:hypothetical protein